MQQLRLQHGARRVAGRRIRGAGVPVRWIVFPRYQVSADTELRPLDRAATLARLLGECKIVTSDLDKSDVAALVKWLREVDCYELTLSSLPDAVALMRQLCLD